MFIYLFERFLFNPKLLLTDLRSEYAGYLSAVAAFLAVATFVLSNCLIFRSCHSLSSWLIGSLLHLTVLSGLGLLYLSLVHVFSGEKTAAARISDLLAYSGFALWPLFLSLPLAFIALALNLGTFLYLPGALVIASRIAVNLILGVRDNYQLGTAQAVTLSLSPLLFLLAWPVIILLLVMLRS